MSTLEILKIPDPILRRRARKVRRIDKKLLALAHDMVETIREAGGVGLAANQVGELKRLVVIQLPEEEEARVYINPEILRRRGERQIEEGCLSHPGFRAQVNRSVAVRFGALDHSETAIRIDAEELLAQAIEHEVDHLNGILYLDHLVAHTQPYEVDEEGNRIGEHGESEEDATPASEADSEIEDTPASLKVT